jgi:hypothetical protein
VVLAAVCALGAVGVASSTTLAGSGDGPGSDVTWATWMPGGLLESRLYVGLCAEIGGSSTTSGVALTQWPCAGVNGSLGGANQVWDLVAGDVYRQQVLRNRASRKCMTEAVTTAKQQTCVFEGSTVWKQTWALEPTSVGFFRIRSLSTNSCLRAASTAAHGAALVLGSCSGTAAEWKSRGGPVEAGYGYTNRVQTFRPLTTPRSHFWAAPFSFVTQTSSVGVVLGGYVGLQRDAQTNIGPMTKAAVFSIWGASNVRNVRAGGAVGSWDDEVGQITGEGGYGISCVVPYGWSDGTAYNIDIGFTGYGTGPTTPTTTNTVAGKWWTASVNGARICDLFVPGIDRRGSAVHLLSSRSSSFSEDFSSGHTACVAPDGHFEARFDPPYVWSPSAAALDS